MPRAQHSSEPSHPLECNASRPPKHQKRHRGLRRQVQRLERPPRKNRFMGPLSAPAILEVSYLLHRRHPPTSGPEHFRRSGRELSPVPMIIVSRSGGLQMAVSVGNSCRLSFYRNGYGSRTATATACSRPWERDSLSLASGLPEMETVGRPEAARETEIAVSGMSALPSVL